MKRASPILLLLSLLISVLTMVCYVQPAKTSGTIYIKANGLVEGTDKILNENNVKYTFTGDINDSIVVQRHNIIIDGAGYTLQGAGATLSRGIDLTGRTNVTVRNTHIKNFQYGISLNGCSYSNISGNTIRANTLYGISLDYSSSNSIGENNIANNRNGIWLSYSSNNNISGNTIKANTYYGIRFYHSSNYNSIIRNTIATNIYGIGLNHSSISNISENNITANNESGIGLEAAHNNTIAGNNITANDCGIRFLSSIGNSISGNNIKANNQYGIQLGYASNNRFYHNNLIDNSQQVNVYTPRCANAWDVGYPTGGNYWRDYNGTDFYSGPYQNETGSDGIGDLPYVIDSGNIDKYPLMGRFYDFVIFLYWTTGGSEHVYVVSNSTVEDLILSVWLDSPNQYLQPGQEFLFFKATGEDDTMGFCRIMIPRTALNSSSYTVLVDWTPVTVTELENSNSTHTYLCFAYNHPTQEIIIIPEFPSFLTLPLFMISTPLVAILYRRKRATHAKTLLKARA